MIWNRLTPFVKQVTMQRSKYKIVSLDLCSTFLVVVRVLATIWGEAPTLFDAIGEAKKYNPIVSFVRHVQKYTTSVTMLFDAMLRNHLWSVES